MTWLLTIFVLYAGETHHQTFSVDREVCERFASAHVAGETIMVDHAGGMTPASDVICAPPDPCGCEDGAELTQ